jgi:hypothetical protein
MQHLGTPVTLRLPNGLLVVAFPQAYHSLAASHDGHPNLTDAAHALIIMPAGRQRV